jgi:hypothetical protein
MHAQWIRQHTITFETHGGSPVPDAVTADVGTAVPQPADPTRTDGYRFLGWFNAASGGTEYTWDHTLTANITMHAQWVRQHTITFETHGGSPVPDAVTADTGTAVPKPADPTRTDGYRFLGWFPAASGGAAYTWDHTLTADVTMHAQWRPEASIGITITDHDGKLLEDPGKAISISKAGNDHDPSFTATVNNGYTVIQWYLNGDPIDGSRGKADSIRMNAQDYPKGSYYLGISATRGGVYYSTDIYFTVTD